MHIRVKEKLSNLRSEHGWSREEAAKKSKVPFTAYESYEKFNRKPSGEYAIAIAKAFDVSVEYLLDDKKGYPPSKTDRQSGGAHPSIEELDTSVLHGGFRDYFSKHPEKLALLSQTDLQELTKTFEYGGEALNIESCVNSFVNRVEEARGYCEIKSSSWVVKKQNHKLEQDERLKEYKKGLGNQPREMMVTSVNMMLEFILVALIIGTLSVTALPKFMTLGADAERGVARGITGTLRSSISILHSRVLFGGIDSYNVTDIVEGVDTQGVTIVAGDGVITAVFASKNMYTWSVEGPTLPETMAILTPNF